MKRLLLALTAMLCSVMAVMAALPARLASAAPAALTRGTVVLLAGTPHMWVADNLGVLHWNGDTRALSAQYVDWSSRLTLSLPELLTMPRGEPWLSAGLLKDGDAIYLVKWETNEHQPRLFHIQSIADVELLGINAGNYGTFVIGRALWEQQFGFSTTGLVRLDLAPVASTTTGITTATIPSTATPAGRADYATLVLADAPAGYWRLNETQGRTAADSSGHSRSGTYVGTIANGIASGPLAADPQPVTQISGTNFDSGDYVTMGNIFDAPNAFTLEAWVDKTGTSSFDHGYVIAKGSSGNTGYGLAIYQGKVQLRIRDTLFMVSGTTTLSLNTWYHVAGTYDGTTARVYLNGTQEAAATPPFTPPPTGIPFQLGNGNGNEDLEFIGRIAEAAYYPRALTSQQMLAHYQAGTAGNLPPVAQPGDLGGRWNGTEGMSGTWSSVWTRRGTSNVFDGVSTEQTSGGRVTYEITIDVAGNEVTARRRLDSDGNDCDYTGTIAEDGRTVLGTQYCYGVRASFPWQAHIDRL